MIAVLLAVAAALLGAGIAALVVARRIGREVALAPSTAEQVLANASDAVIACGADGTTITAWNPAAERMFGWRATEILGRQLPTLGDDDVSRERASLLDRVRAGEPVSVVTRRMSNDGAVIDVRINYSEIRGPDGSFTGWMGVVTDVTEELAVARERAERSELVERLNAVVADVNAELDLPAVLDRITTSAAQLLGASGAGFAIVEEQGRASPPRPAWSPSGWTTGSRLARGRSSRRSARTGSSSSTTTSPNPTGCGCCTASEPR